MSNLDSERWLRDVLGDVGSAFMGAFPSLRDMQRQVIPRILRGESVLVCSATASGKTEAILAPMIRRIRTRPSIAEESGPFLLAIAPTRALVNDLFRRIDVACGSFGWKAGAQTSDHRHARGRPEILITTPESFDSMLVRGLSDRKAGNAGHILANVRGVFLDEIHCYSGGGRGEQLKFLVQRLIRLRRAALNLSDADNIDLQICAASATVDTPESLATEVLGPSGRAISVRGARTISLISPNESWHTLDPSDTPDLIKTHIWKGIQTSARIGGCFTRLLGEDSVRKILLFVPSRALCDGLAAGMRPIIEKDFVVWVGAHHGSLSKHARETAEKEFSTKNRRAVLVATSTLEVGVDIGDVDLVGIWGAPPNVSALLQRVGRGGRRSDTTRIMALADTPGEIAVLSSMLASAVRGNLDDRVAARPLGVFIQQVASYISQNGSKGRTRNKLISLAQEAWNSSDSESLAGRTLDELLAEGYLHEQRGKIYIDSDLAARFDKNPVELHSNIISTPAPMAVKDRVSGEIIGHISELSANSSQINIGGVGRTVVNRRRDEIIVERSASTPVDATAPRYPSVTFRITRTYAKHAARGIGLIDEDAPIVEMPDGKSLWFHFGGEILERFLLINLPRAVQGVAEKGIALHISASLPQQLSSLRLSNDFDKQVQGVIKKHPSLFRVSSFDDLLSIELLTKSAASALSAESMSTFLSSRHIFVMELGSDQNASLLSLIG